jgi:hypothetical protein
MGASVYGRRARFLLDGPWRYSPGSRVANLFGLKTGKNLPPRAMQLEGIASTCTAPLQNKGLEASQQWYPEVVIS